MPMMSTDEFMAWSAVVRQAEREVEQRGVQWSDVPKLVTVGMWLGVASTTDSPTNSKAMLIEALTALGASKVQP
jgi:hypothetical protein